MSGILQQIVAAMRPELDAAKRREPAAAMRRRAEAAAPALDFAAAFRGHDGFRVIAELKPASPSKGVIRQDFRCGELARGLAAGGAAALSVLTERNYFHGGLDHLDAARRAVPLPLLRKDFLFDPYQIDEARAHGADAVLLIAALLTDQGRLRELAGQARELGMAVLGEAHDAAEVGRLLESPVTLIGVNARDLNTFRTDLGVTGRLLRDIPADRLPVAESAIRSREDLERLREAGAAGFLIGETLMRAPEPGAKLAELIG